MRLRGSRGPVWKAVSLGRAGEQAHRQGRVCMPREVPTMAGGTELTPGRACQGLRTLTAAEAVPACVPLRPGSVRPRPGRPAAPAPQDSPAQGRGSGETQGSGRVEGSWSAGGRQQGQEQQGCHCACCGPWAGDVSQVGRGTAWWRGGRRLTWPGRGAACVNPEPRLRVFPMPPLPAGTALRWISHQGRWEPWGQERAACPRPQQRACGPRLQSRPGTRASAPHCR